MLQVGLYCREVSRIWNAVMTTNKEGIDDEIKQFAKQQLVNTQTDKRNIYEGWNVTGIKAGSEVTKYINSVETSFHEYGPNVLISTYACAKLWPQLTCELKQVLENDLRDRNPYKVWVDANETFGSTARAQAQLMDGHKGFDHEKAHLMFRNAMQNEIDLFNRGGKAP
ncbi:hypothetical protein KP509_26G003700 [Ceratopteris richardii]|nr:hypothetical protein KP509_26G003700 [Ceratopteris richardii]